MKVHSIRRIFREQRVLATLAVIALLSAAGSAGAAIIPNSAAPVVAGPALPWTPPAPAWLIPVRIDGLYAVSYADLAAASFPVDTVDPRFLRVYAMGREVPVWVAGEEDGRFDAGDTLLFYGRGVDSLFLDGFLPTNKYTPDMLYWLTSSCLAAPCDGSMGRRMAERAEPAAEATPAPYAHREHVEKNFWYHSAYPPKEGADHWYGDWVTPTVSRTITINAFNLPAEAPDATLEVDLLGWGSSSHRAQVSINGKLAHNGSERWSGFQKRLLTIPVPRSFMVEGANRIRVGLLTPDSGGSDTAYLNWVRLSYRDSYVAESGALAFTGAEIGAWRYELSNFVTDRALILDVTDPLAPDRIPAAISGAGPYTATFSAQIDTSRAFFAVEPAAWRKPASIARRTQVTSPYRVADLLDPTNSADYILISHVSFWDQAQRLAAHRAQEMSVALIDVQQIYDQFNGGMVSAEAIRDFLAYAYATWSAPAPKYVLFMGDGSSDMRKYRSSAETYIPPFLALVDPGLGETAADNRFVTVSGADILPDMSIGRFPVNTPAQARAVVDKTIAYENECSCGMWSYRGLFVTDNLDGGGGDFYYYSDVIADGFADPPANTTKLIPPYYRRNKVYLGATCGQAGSSSPGQACRQEITDTLNNDGALFMSYVGHATKEYWAAERVFDKVAVSNLATNACLPVILAMTCYEGAFHEPDIAEVMAESYIRLAGSGAVASFSPTGLGIAEGHDFFERGVMLAWFQEDITRLGPGMDYSKRYLDQTARPGEHRELIDTLTLLGDPALEFKGPSVCMKPTGVTVRAFSAAQERAGVRVSWETGDETQIAGFNLLRKVAPGGTRRALNAELILARRAGVSGGARYKFEDADVTGGETYEYVLEIVSVSGDRAQSQPITIRVESRGAFVPFVVNP